MVHYARSIWANHEKWRTQPIHHATSHLRFGAFRPILRLPARCSAPGGFYLPTGAFGLLTTTLSTHNPCSMVFWHPSSKLAKHRPFYEATTTTQPSPIRTHSAHNHSRPALSMSTHGLTSCHGGSLWPALPTSTHRLSLAMGIFFLGMQLSYMLGFFFYQGLFYCPLSTISFYHSLFL